MRLNLKSLVLSMTTLFLVIYAQAATFQRLGDLSGGEYSSSAAAVSADGSTVVGQSGSDASRTASILNSLSNRFPMVEHLL